MPAGSRRGAFDLVKPNRRNSRRAASDWRLFCRRSHRHPRTSEMLKSTDDLRITDIRELRTPAEVMHEFPRTDAATRTVLASRHALHNILHGNDDRLAVVVGPCSIH